ncbi:MAG: AI-2E family transporter [Archangiaceae bacterium]|nr:AI-2E family transporter [Archangiaceae bacterium]
MRRLNVGPVAEVALVIAIVAIGKPVWIPVTLAFYFAFILTPPSDALERRGASRLVSLLVVVGAAMTLFLVLSSILVSQAADLATQLHTYSAQINQKLARLGGIGLVENFRRAMDQLGAAFAPDSEASLPTTAVRIAETPRLWQRLEEAVRPILEPIAMSGLVLVLTLFVLGRREDLRARMIRLAGPQNVTVTTRTMDEAVRRISHLLLTQVWINAAFGAVLAVALHLIGIPYGLLWGFIAGLLRFVPMLGAAIAVLLPSLIAFAIFPGWRETACTVVLFVFADIVVANFVEPLVLGRRTGVSSLALLISAVFWTWMWGPVGLVLATPLTVCAAVMGRNVPQLAFLTVLLGDEPGLNAEVNFYQRVLAQALRDAERIGRAEISKSSLASALDALLVPALALAGRDQNQQAIDDATAERVVGDVGKVLAALAPPASAKVAHPVLGLAAETRSDAVLLQMLAMVGGGRVEAQPPAERAAAVDAVVRRAPKAVIIASLPPAGSASTRYLCRRLRAQLPGCHVVVLLHRGVDAPSSEAAARLREAGATEVVLTLGEAQKALAALSLQAAEAGVSGAA